MKKQRPVLTILSIILFSIQGLAQGSGLPLQSPAYHILDRLEIKSGLRPNYISSIKYYLRGNATQYAMQIDTSSIPLSAADRQDLYYLFKDNNEWLTQAPLPTTLGGRRSYAQPGEELTQVEASMANPRYILSKKPFLNFFYPSPANMVEINEKFFHLRVNPLLDIHLGPTADDQSSVFYNMRGAELRGGVDDRIFFYLNITETQARFPDYVNRRIDQYQSIPGAGFFKPYESSIFNVTDGYDFLNSQGYLAFNFTPHVGLQFGYGRNFIGNGYRSLILSDFANNRLYLKLNWQLGKFHYQNLFAELAAESEKQIPEGAVVAKKYMATHYLGIQLLKNLSVGVFESVIYSRGNGTLELQYMNPIIFYRAAEQGLNSPDNVLIGFDAKWNFLRHFQLYGQINFDEFRFRDLVIDRNGSWANKFGIQGGFKYIDAFGIDHLDFQGEFNIVRPYTYTHRDSTASYAHYNQPLAHPLGANFQEILFIARYQPVKNLFLEGRIIRANFGEDEADANWGHNILLPHQTRVRDFNNSIGQGVEANTTIIGLDISYMIRHNVFLDLYYFDRSKDSQDNSLDDDLRFIGGGFRINMAKFRQDY